MDENNVFTGKTVEEAIALGLQTLNLTEDQAEIKVIEEGKKKLIGGVKAKVMVSKKLSDAERSVKFIEGLFDIIGIDAVAQVVSDDEKVEISLTTMDSSRIIGHHGDTLDAIQTLAGAVANIGNEKYKKVIVDCENYRNGREATLRALAEKLAEKAVAKRRRVWLEPMNPYERRIIHAALADSEEVKTISEGKEPYRRVVIVPNDERPYVKREDRGERKFNGDRGHRGDRKYSDRRGGRSFNRDRKYSDRRRSDGDGVKSAKKEIRFGTFLGNSGNDGNKE